MAKTEYGKRLLHHVVDEYVAADPEKIYAYQSVVDKSYDLGFRYESVTYRTVAQGMNATASWLNSNLARQLAISRSVAFLGCSDLRNTFITLAGVKYDITILFLNIFGTSEQILKFMADNDCHVIVFTKEREGYLPPDCDAVEMPSMEEILKLNINEEMEGAATTFEEAKGNIFAVMQTSGSTGNAKNVRISNERAAFMDICGQISTYHGRPNNIKLGFLGARSAYVGEDWAYIDGVDRCIASAILEGVIIVLSPPGVESYELQPRQFCEMMKLCKIDSAYFYPNVLEVMINDPSAAASLSSCLDVSFGGGPLNEPTMCKVTSLCHMSNLTGSTEVGCSITHEVDTEDAKEGYICFNSPMMGWEWREADDGLYEPVIIRKPELAHLQPVFMSFPHLHEWPMGDLYFKHPDPNKIDHWKFYGRANDTIILHSAEKVNPSTWDDFFHGISCVKAVAIIGNGRLEIGAIIDFADDSTSERNNMEILDEIWPLIDEQNATVGQLKRLSRSRIMFASPEKPLVKNRKGNISRKKTELAYAEEIQDMYSVVESEKSSILSASSQNS